MFYKTDDKTGFGSFKIKQYPPGAIPANMTHIFQPLDLIVNKSAKSFFKRNSLQSGIPMKFSCKCNWD